MAGNGYLSKFLVEAGYRNIHALEASNYMANDAFLKNKHITLHAIENIFTIDKILKEVRPNVIVSIAGFHHMLEYDEDIVNVEKSIDKQIKIIDICMKYLDKNGIFIIEDIRDNDMSDLIDNEPEYWSLRSFNKIFKKRDNLFPVDWRKQIKKTKNIEEYSSIVSELLMPPLQKETNPTTRWFHEIVDKETKVGHKDVPVGKKLIERLADSYKVNFAKINTPWIFSNISECESFLKLLWFKELNNDKGKMKAIFEKAEEINGIRRLEGSKKVAFGWNLALLTIQSKEQEPPSLFYRNIIWLLLIIIFVSLFGIALKINTTLDLIVKSISNILVFVAGVSAKEIYDNFKCK